jgi:hypothetical protein
LRLAETLPGNHKIKRKRAKSTTVSKEQAQILKYLSIKYPLGEKITDWITAMKDPLAKKLNSRSHTRAAIEFYRINQKEKFSWKDLPVKKRKQYTLNNVQKKKVKAANEFLYQKLMT